MAYYERNLPHWHPEGKDIFLTWRLFGSLPASSMYSLRPLPKNTAGEQFRAVDAELDKALHGPLWLKDLHVAECVENTLRRGEIEWDYYVLHAHVVMANHVHMLVGPKVSLSRITHRLKGASAREANRILAREGKRFWQDETFDHWIRDAAEFQRVKAYIEENPVSAGLVQSAGDWRWSSANKSLGSPVMPERPDK